MFIDQQVEWLNPLRYIHPLAYHIDIKAIRSRHNLLAGNDAHYARQNKKKYFYIWKNFILDRL